MIRSALPLAFAAAFGLSACGSNPNTQSSRTPQPSASATQGQPIGYQAGSGVVQSVTAAPRMASAGSSSGPVTTTRKEPVGAAGAAAGSTAVAMQRLAIRMDDGRVQYVDMAGPDIPPVGSRVQLTPDHQIIRQQ
jgi:hypothetical protein